MQNVDIIKNFPFFSIFLAMLCGIITSPIRRGKTAWFLCFFMAIIELFLSLTLLIRLAAGHESFTFMMGHFPAPWGNELKAGPLEALMATFFSSVFLLSLLGGRSAAFHDILPEKQKLYFIMLNMLMGAMLALIYTNDLFTAYVFIEISTIAACGIVMAKDTPRSLAATMRYLITMLLGSGLFLIGVIILYVVTGHLLMESIAVSLQSIVATGLYAEPLRIIVALIIVGISVKSAVFPFHTVLPGAHGVATPTSSAILSGLVIKCFVLLIIKLFFRVFTVELLSDLGITQILFVFGAASALICSWLALKEVDLKRMIAFSSSAQIGYVYMGLGLATTGGGAVACFHIIAHGLMKSMLFICAGGLADVSDHKTMIRALRGSAYKNKFAGVGFTIGALSMIGLPMLSGFVSKLYLATSAASNPPVMVIVLLILIGSMILNALYFIPVIAAIWTRDGEDQEEAQKPKITFSFKLSISIFAALNLLLGIFFQPIIAIIQDGLSLL